MDLPEPDRSRFVEVNRTRLRLWEWGDPTNAPVICLHGAYDHGRMWNQLGPPADALDVDAEGADLTESSAAGSAALGARHRSVAGPGTTCTSNSPRSRSTRCSSSSERTDHEPWARGASAVGAPRAGRSTRRSPLARRDRVVGLVGRRVRPRPAGPR